MQTAYNKKNKKLAPILLISEDILNVQDGICNFLKDNNLNSKLILLEHDGNDQSLFMYYPRTNRVFSILPDFDQEYFLLKNGSETNSASTMGMGLNEFRAYFKSLLLTSSAIEDEVTIFIDNEITQDFEKYLADK